MSKFFSKITVSLLLLNCHRRACGFLCTTLSFSRSTSSLCGDRRCCNRRTNSLSIKAVQVTTLPEFNSKEEYDEFIKNPQVSALPKGFSCGSAVGTFVAVESPALGNLPIKATVISLDQPTDSWAACFTKNKVNRRQITLA